MDPEYSEAVTGRTRRAGCSAGADPADTKRQDKSIQIIVDERALGPVSDVRQWAGEHLDAFR